MTKNVRVLRLLETLMDSGSTPEEVCTDCPELLPQVLEQWDLCRKIDARIDALFGEADPAAPQPDGVQPDLPRIPGYRVTAVQGRGGIGIVYRARHLGLNRMVALKMLLSGAFAGRVERARFLREARAVAGLRHNNIVQVFDVGEFDRRPFFTMELVEGRTLAGLLHGEPQPAAAAAAMLVTLADAVAYAHGSGVIHRDLKPANVLTTPDGTPKISDFGLALRLEEDEGLTPSGVRLGTPSYMAPEQALGKETPGPAVDLYSLGAILYEMLCGRPPFRGESPAETERQLLSETAVRPSKLNSAVPRDLETVCLKCLEKDPRRRYATAAALADDLRRFQRREPIAARRTGAVERAARWILRHRAISTAVAASLVVAALLITGITWVACQRAAAVKIAELELHDAVAFQNQCAWDQAAAALDRAEYKLGGRGPASLRRNLEQARHDEALAGRLESIRLDRSGSSKGMMNFLVSRDRYIAEFRQSGFGTSADEPAAVAARIRGSNIRAELVAALYDWMLIPSVRERDWLWDVAGSADESNSTWRASVHTSAVWDDGPALLKRAETAPLASQPVPVLMAVAYRLHELHQPSAPFLLKVQGAYPEDFWVNLTLADQLRETNQDADSILYYQAAAALRPMSTVVHNNLALALSGLGRTGESVAELRRARDLDPQSMVSTCSLAMQLHAAGSYQESMQWFKVCLTQRPDDPGALWGLGRDLVAVGRIDEAIPLLRRSLAVDPRGARTLNELVNALLARGRGDEAIAAWRTLIAHDPANHDAWNGYGELCLYLGRDEEFGRVRDSLLKQFGGNLDPNICERVGRCVLLSPASPGQTRQAGEIIDRAIAADRDHPTSFGRYFRVAKALAEYRAGHYAAAIVLLHGDCATVLGPAPGLLLAMTEQQLGRHDAAVSSLAAAVAGFNWWHPETDPHDYWIYSILRKEAEGLIGRPLAHLP